MWPRRVTATHRRTVVSGWAPPVVTVRLAFLVFRFVFRFVCLFLFSFFDVCRLRQISLHPLGSSCSLRLIPLVDHDDVRGGPHDAPQPHAPLQKPVLEELYLRGTCEEGCVLAIEERFTDGVRGESDFRWIRNKADGSRQVPFYLFLLFFFVSGVGVWWVVAMIFGATHMTTSHLPFFFRLMQRCIGR